MNCEMCAKDLPKLRAYRVDGVKMMLCMDCGKFGEPVQTAAPGTPGASGTPGQAQASRQTVGEKLEQRARRMGSSKDALAGGEEELAPDFGERIRRAREKKGWTREQLADKVQQPVPTVTKFEAGSLHPSDRAVKTMEKVLDIKLMEKVETSDYATRAAPQQPARGLTLGDLIKEAQKKNK